MKYLLYVMDESITNFSAYFLITSDPFTILSVKNMRCKQLSPNLIDVLIANILSKRFIFD